ncbi:hypothetical protein E2542_SST02139 [Spatholobus suberectus]|nr:hypothetical protein E2542_SST02139 [Spatholobus suberectus]
MCSDQARVRGPSDAYKILGLEKLSQPSTTTTKIVGSKFLYNNSWIKPRLGYCKIWWYGLTHECIGTRYGGQTMGFKKFGQPINVATVARSRSLNRIQKE